MSSLEDKLRAMILDMLKTSPTKGIDVINLFKEVEDEVIKVATKRYVYDMLKEKALNNPNADPVHKLVFSHIQSKEDKKAKMLYKSITISPPDNFFKKESIISILNKLFNKSWIQEYEYCIEQRGKTMEEIGKGVHVHALVKLKGTKSKAHIIRELSASLGVQKQCIDVDTAYQPEGFRNYMRGEKNDPQKQDAVALNPQFREMWKLKDIYGNFGGL